MLYSPPPEPLQQLQQLGVTRDQGRVTLHVVMRVEVDVDEAQALLSRHGTHSTRDIQDTLQLTMRRVAPVRKFVLANNHVRVHGSSEVRVSNTFASPSSIRKIRSSELHVLYQGEFILYKS